MCVVFTDKEDAMSYLRILELLVCVAVLAACNTVEGVGKDVKQAGQAIEKAAEKAK